MLVQVGPEEPTSPEPALAHRRRARVCSGMLALLRAARPMPLAGTASAAPPNRPSSSQRRCHRSRFRACKPGSPEPAAGRHSTSTPRSRRQRGVRRCSPQCARRWLVEHSSRDRQEHRPLRRGCSDVPHPRVRRRPGAEYADHSDDHDLLRPELDRLDRVRQHSGLRLHDGRGHRGAGDRSDAVHSRAVAGRDRGTHRVDCAAWRERAPPAGAATRFTQAVSIANPATAARR